MEDENLTTTEEETAADTQGTEWEDVDYKTLYEQEKAEKEKALADSKKWEWRFKTTKAKENQWKTQGVTTDDVKKMVDDWVNLVRFYSDNKGAIEYQEDIETLVAKWIDRNQAFKYVLAEKDPTQLLDEAKKAQLSGNTALTWVPWKLWGQKDPYLMTDEEVAQLSDAEFEKLFPSWADQKKFYAETK